MLHFLVTEYNASTWGALPYEGWIMINVQLHTVSLFLAESDVNATHLQACCCCVPADIAIVFRWKCVVCLLKTSWLW
jgi:hypothetical protein